MSEKTDREEYNGPQASCRQSLIKIFNPVWAKTFCIFLSFPNKYEVHCDLWRAACTRVQNLRNSLGSKRTSIDVSYYGVWWSSLPPLAFQIIERFMSWQIRKYEIFFDFILGKVSFFSNTTLYWLFIPNYSNSIILLINRTNYDTYRNWFWTMNKANQHGRIWIMDVQVVVQGLEEVHTQSTRQRHQRTQVRKLPLRKDL